MPREIEDVFAQAGTRLFPSTVRQLRMHCTCPDATVPCKHIAATFYLLAEAFDADPFEILHWRGRDKETLLATLRSLRTPTRSARRTPVAAPPAPAAGSLSALASVPAPPLESTVDRFWVAPVPLPTRPPTMDTEVDLLLRQLSTPPAAIGGADLAARLRQLYQSFRPT